MSDTGQGNIRWQCISPIELERGAITWVNETDAHQSSVTVDAVVSRGVTPLLIAMFGEMVPL